MSDYINVWSNSKARPEPIGKETIELHVAPRSIQLHTRRVYMKFTLSGESRYDLYGLANEWEEKSVSLVGKEAAKKLLKMELPKEAFIYGPDHLPEADKNLSEMQGWGVWGTRKPGRFGVKFTSPSRYDMSTEGMKSEGLRWALTQIKELKKAGLQQHMSSIGLQRTIGNLEEGQTMFLIWPGKMTDDDLKTTVWENNSQKIFHLTKDEADPYAKDLGFPIVNGSVMAIWRDRAKVSTIFDYLRDETNLLRYDASNKAYQHLFEVKAKLKKVRRMAPSGLLYRDELREEWLKDRLATSAEVLMG